MPRLQGQVDESKTDAILEAAGAVFAAKGLSASIDEVARRAAVSKQTIYNRYGSKTELVRAMVTRRVADISSPLQEAGTRSSVEDTLAAYAETLMVSTLLSRALTILQITVQAAAHMPDMARAFYDAGPRANRLALAAYLERETGRGRLAVENAYEAAEFFSGMVVTTRQMAALLAVDLKLDEPQIRHVAQEAAARFVRAYAP
jgi:TetR/AcrR family transcriptional repressor of mexJK operon